MVFQDAQTISVVDKLMVFLVMVLGIANTAASHSNMEELLQAVLTSISSLICVLSLVRHISDESKDNNFVFPVSSNIFAQLIQSTLATCKHPSKSIAVTSLKTLLPLMQSRIVTVDNWRTYFPGVFSALFGICSKDRDRYCSTIPYSVAPKFFSVAFS